MGFKVSDALRAVARGFTQCIGRGAERPTRRSSTATDSAVAAEIGDHLSALRGDSYDASSSVLNLRRLPLDWLPKDPQSYTPVGRDRGKLVAVPVVAT
jgi:hypothetical protein